MGRSQSRRRASHTFRCIYFISLQSGTCTIAVALQARLIEILENDKCDVNVRSFNDGAFCSCELRNLCLLSLF